MGYAEVKAQVDALGNGTLEVNGEDVSNRVTGFTIRAARNSPTEVFVEMRPGATSFEGEGVVKVFGAEEDFLAAMDRVLAGMPAQAIEQEVLMRDGQGSFGELFIAVLREMVQRAGG